MAETQTPATPKSETEQAVAAIGPRMESPQDWIAVALACIDQAGVPTCVQNEIAARLGYDFGEVQS